MILTTLLTCIVALIQPIVTTSLGAIQGIHRSDCDVYVGIPYACPPVGDLAFRAPVPIAPWDSVLDATHPQGNCIQERSRYSSTHQTRNCLYLNVYVPHHNPGDSLPVMVWLHGGSFATGGTGAATDSTLQYDMGYFAQQMQAIVVTLNYRLNAYGFLYLTPYSSRFDSNCGFRDQILALQWVNEHISHFGGNPHHITLFGQSAGAASVLALMSNPQARTLFHQVIMMSPCVDHFMPFNEALMRTNRYLRCIGLSDRRVDKMLSVSDSRIQSANNLYKTQTMLGGDFRCAFSPAIDGDILPQAPWIGALECQYPMIIGYTANESELFTQDIPKWILPALTRKIRQSLENDTIYPTTVDTTDGVSYYDAFTRALSYRMFFAPIDSFYAQYSGPKQRYLYDYRTPQMIEKGVHCNHAIDLAVVFGWHTNLCNPNDSATHAVGDSIRQSWREFFESIR